MQLTEVQDFRLMFSITGKCTRLKINKTFGHSLPRLVRNIFATSFPKAAFRATFIKPHIYGV
jgi:hypothetical protein